MKRGQSVALVGHSGSGKSTVIQLISRYYDVVSGSVSIYIENIQLFVKVVVIISVVHSHWFQPNIKAVEEFYNLSSYIFFIFKLKPC